MLSDSDAPGAQRGDRMQLSPSSPKRSRDDGPDVRGANSSHNDYDGRDKGDYEPSTKRAKMSRQDDDQADFYDDKPRRPRYQRRHGSSYSRSRSRSWSRSRSRSRSRSQSRARGRDDSYRRSRSPAHSPRHHARNTHRSRSRSPVRRHDRDPRDRRNDRGLARQRWGDRSGGRSPPYTNRRHSGASAGGRNMPESTQRDAVRAKQDVTQEDRKRGQRLFGGLLANLRGPATGQRPAMGRGRFDGRPGGRPAAAAAEAAQDKATPLEPCDRSKPGTADQMQTDDDDTKTKTAERLAKLERIRKIEQVRFDEKKMHTLQANNLALARCLETQSKPHLYYHPRDLSGQQEETIKSQVRDAERRALEQRQAFEKDKAERLSALGVKYTPKILAAITPEPAQQDTSPTTEAHTDSAPRRDPDEMVDEPTATAAATEAAERVDTKAASPDRASVHMDDGESTGQIEEQHVHHEQHDHNDDRDKDVMVETEEDTVIY